MTENEQRITENDGSNDCNKVKVITFNPCVVLTAAFLPHSLRKITCDNNEMFSVLQNDLRYVTLTLTPR